MRDPEFAEKVTAALQPILAARGFPCQHDSVNRDAVLFHCDGENVDDVLARYPDWLPRLRESYGGHRLPCLDLWVRQDGQRWTWSFEIFEGDVAAEVGADAMQRLDELQTAPLEEWLAQLAEILDRYFSSLDASNN